MKELVCLLLAMLLLLFAYVVFRLIIRNDYATRGRLSTISSSLQLLVFVGYFMFPYQFNPPEWPWFWMASTSSSKGLHLLGLVIICLGFLVAFGTMAWFGIRRAFGIHVDGLKKVGPYRISRNPQILGGYFLIIGTSLQWPSLFTVGWIFLYAIIAHWMVITEEEYLKKIFGEEYIKYCMEVPRYLLVCGEWVRSST